MTGHLLNFRPQIFYAERCSMLLADLKIFQIARLFFNEFKGIENLPCALYLLHH